MLFLFALVVKNEIVPVRRTNYGAVCGILPFAETVKEQNAIDALNSELHPPAS